MVKGTTFPQLWVSIGINLGYLGHMVGYARVFCLFALIFSFSGCKKDEWTLKGNDPVEKTFLLFPGTQKSITVNTRQYIENIDIGLDFDVHEDAIELKIVSGKREFKAVKLPGTFMPLVGCNIPVNNGKVTLLIRHVSLAKSAWAAVRIAPSISKMCAPTTPIWDDYVVRLP